MFPRVTPPKFNDFFMIISFLQISSTFHEIQWFFHDLDTNWNFKDLSRAVGTLLAPDCSISSALVMEILQSCTKPSILCKTVLWISPNSWVAHWTTHGGKLGCLNHFLVQIDCPNYFELSFKRNLFLVINTKFACFIFNHVPTYRELGHPSGDFMGLVGSQDRVMGRIWQLGDLLSTALSKM